MLEDIRRKGDEEGLRAAGEIEDVWGSYYAVREDLKVLEREVRVLELPSFERERGVEVWYDSVEGL